MRLPNRTACRSAAGSGPCTPRAAVWDVEQQAWRDGRGRKVPSPGLARDVPVRTTRVVLAAAVSTTTQRIVDTGTATSGLSASGATCCTTGRSTGGAY